MSSLRVRGQHVAIRVNLDNKPQAGSFTKVENFKITPDASLNATPFLGESEDEPDLIHNGYEFSFSIHETDGAAIRFYNDIVQKQAQGLPLPKVDITAITSYVDVSQGVLVQALQDAVIKLDNRDAGGRKDYVKNSFSGRCRIVETL